MELRTRKEAVEYAIKYGYTKGEKKYGYFKQTLHRWAKRYDGSVESLIPKSRRPKSHPNEHTKEELEHIKRVYNRYKSKGLRTCI